MPFSRGQVSLEALLLFAALAGSIAMALPAFMGTLDAFSLRLEVREIDALSLRLEKVLSDLAYAGPGTQVVVKVPLLPGLSSEIREDSIELTLTHPRFSSPHVWEARSLLPLDGFPLPGEEAWVLTRTGSGITIG